MHFSSHSLTSALGNDYITDSFFGVCSTYVCVQNGTCGMYVHMRGLIALRDKQL